MPQGRSVSFPTRGISRRAQSQRCGRLENTIRRLMQLVKERNVEDELLEKRYPNGWDRFRAGLTKGSEPKHEASLEALTELTPEDIRKVELVMYSGREDQHVLEMHRTLKEEDPDIAVSIVFEKSPLDEYLAKGLKKTCAARRV
jgi:hypothetical protein